MPPIGGRLTTEGGRVTLRFEEGAFTGDATVTIEPIPCGTWGAPPQGFRIGDSCFRITAMVDGELVTDLLAKVTICVRYSAADKAAANGNPPRLTLAYYDQTNNQWQIQSSEVHTSAGTICTTTNRLGDWSVLARIVVSGLVWWHYLLLVGVGALVVFLSHTPRKQPPETKPLEEPEPEEVTGPDET